MVILFIKELFLSLLEKALIEHLFAKKVLPHIKA